MVDGMKSERGQRTYDVGLSDIVEDTGESERSEFPP
jgi:hypothetical protein